MLLLGGCCYQADAATRQQSSVSGLAPGEGTPMTAWVHPGCTPQHPEMPIREPPPVPITRIAAQRLK